MPLATPPVAPQLLEGERLDRYEFLTAWEAEPGLKHAELIDGTVCMPSPVSLNHAKYHSLLHTWLSIYSIGTPGCFPSLEATWLMNELNVSQPDIALTILPEYGGQSRAEGLYHAGAPEPIVEVAVSSHSRDFGVKKRLYQQSGVREYLIALPGEQRLLWHENTPSGFRTIETPPDSILRSVTFPGLWLDTAALWSCDLPRIDAVVRQGLATPEHSAFVTRLAAQKR